MRIKADDEGYTALHLYAAAGNGDTEKVKSLLRTRHKYLDKKTVETARGMASDLGHTETAATLSNYLKRTATREKRSRRSFGLQ